MKKKLQEELQRVMGQLTTLRDLPERTAEQETEIDTLSARATELMGKINRETELEAITSRVAASANALPAGGAPSAPNARAIVVPAQARRETRAFRSQETAYAFGQFLRASLGRNAQAAQWLQDHGYALTRSQTEGDNTAGGFLVPGEFGSVLDSLVASYGVIRQYATESVMSRDTKSHPKRPLLIRFRAGSELGAMTDDTARFGNIELVAKKAYLLLNSSSELSEDAAISLADELAMVIAESAAYTEDDCGFNGDATSTYLGITGIFNKLNGIASNAGVITLTGATTYEAVTRTQLISIKGSLPAAAAANGDPAWYVSRKGGIEMMERIALEQGGATAAEILAGANPRFLGDPVRVVNAITDAETSGGFALAYGSMRKGVVFGNRRELTVVNSQEAGFLTDSEYWRATERFDINVHEPGSSTAPGALIVAKFA